MRNPADRLKRPKRRAPAFRRSVTLGVVTACFLCGLSLKTRCRRSVGQGEEVVKRTRERFCGGKDWQEDPSVRVGLREEEGGAGRLRGGWYTDGGSSKHEAVSTRGVHGGYGGAGGTQVGGSTRAGDRRILWCREVRWDGKCGSGAAPVGHHTGGVNPNAASYYPPTSHRPVTQAGGAVHQYPAAGKRPYQTTKEAALTQPRKKDKVNQVDSYISVQPGDMLCNRYRVLGLKGQGTFGTVVDSIDTKYNRKIALKEVEILRRLSELDPKRECRCVRLYNAFEMTHANKRHIGIVFERLGRDLHRFIKENKYRGFHMAHVKHFAAQLLHAVAFCHSHSLVHTDIKPENILLERSDYRYEKSWGVSDYKVPVSSRIKLIDFGSATWNHNHHSRVITTRQYRAPEVILNVGWTFPADIWSIGCILAELRTGRLLFDTHEDLEHLALMEKITQSPMPNIIGLKHLKHNRDPTTVNSKAGGQDQGGARKLVRENGTINWPEACLSTQSKAHVEKQRPLAGMFSDPLFVDLIQKMLKWHPEERIKPKDALNHPFLHQVTVHQHTSQHSTQSKQVPESTAPSSEKHPGVTSAKGQEGKRSGEGFPETQKDSKRTRLTTLP
ncbi:hypothetical protein AAMO2058_001041400 [Amorphochlora amoebiformis]